MGQLVPLRFLFWGTGENKVTNRNQNSLVPIGEVFGGLDGSVTGWAAFHSPSRLDHHRYRILRAVSCYRSAMFRSPGRTPMLLVAASLLGMQCWSACVHMSSWGLPLEETRNEHGTSCQRAPEQQNHPNEECCVSNTMALRSADSAAEPGNKTIAFHADNPLNTALDWRPLASRTGCAARLSGALHLSSLQSHSTVLRI